LQNTFLKLVKHLFILIKVRGLKLGLKLLQDLNVPLILLNKDGLKLNDNKLFLGNLVGSSFLKLMQVNRFQWGDIDEDIGHCPEDNSYDLEVGNFGQHEKSVHMLNVLLWIGDDLLMQVFYCLDLFVGVHGEQPGSVDGTV